MSPVVECAFENIWEENIAFYNINMALATGKASEAITSFTILTSQIQKLQKTGSSFFRILVLGRPSPPSQLVPNPFNWSPTHSTGPQKMFFTEISVSVAQIKKIQKT